MKSLFSICLIFAFLSPTSGQTERLTGRLIKKEWSKTIESYCAGGSSFYVLLTDEKEEVLLDISAWRKRKIEKKLNKQVILNGRWESVTKSNDDPFTQHPTAAVQCQKFVVKK